MTKASGVLVRRGVLKREGCIGDGGDVGEGGMCWGGRDVLGECVGGNRYSTCKRW